jgi:diguanylate cyclase (GGDEF)-like protein
LLVFGPSTAGSFFSDLIQLILGVALVISAIGAATRSNAIARSYWYLTAFAYGIWLVPQSLSTYGDLFDTPDRLQSLIKFLFSFWLVPLSMTLCLDEESPRGAIDGLLMFDFCQGLFFVIGAYSYFHFNSGFETTLVRSAWGAYFLYYGLLAGAFQLRSILTYSLAARILFRRMAFFLFFCALIDAAYYYGSGSLLQTGSWFDIFWSILLAIPLLFAASWNDLERTELLCAPGIQARGQLLGRIPSLVFPLFVLIFSVRIGQTNVPLALGLVLASFSCSSVKHVLTQYHLIEAQEALRRQASLDGLTGAWNHVGILAILEREMLRAERECKPLGIMMIDVDHFKSVNDTYGHRGGDAALRALVQQCATILRPYDSLGRYGGEEFLVVAPGCDLEDVRELADRIRVHVASHPIALNGEQMRITLSLGIAAHETGVSLESLLGTADSGLYVAKNRGRNRVESVGQFVLSVGQLKPSQA